MVDERRTRERAGDGSSSSATTMDEYSSWSSSSHDLVALGEYASASSFPDRDDEAVLRLPLLSRLSAAARPFAPAPRLSVNAATGVVEASFEEDQNDDEESGGGLDVVVARWEAVAAVHPSAEGMDDVPATVRRIGESFGPYRRRKRRRGGQDEDVWDVSVLERFAKETTAATTTARSSSSSSAFRDDDLVAEDSRENVALVVLSETSKLVLESLRPRKRVRAATVVEEARRTSSDAVATATSEGPTVPTTEDDDDEDDGRLVVRSDSWLAEPPSSFGDGETPLSNSLPSSLHHCPVLRSEHVAAALCRASSSIPRAAAVVRRLGANDPPSVPAAVRGCLNAGGVGGADAAVALARLSRREASSVLNRAIERRDAEVTSRLAFDVDPEAATAVLAADAERYGPVFGERTTRSGTTTTTAAPPPSKRRRLASRARVASSFSASASWWTDHLARRPDHAARARAGALRAVAASRFPASASRALALLVAHAGVGAGSSSGSGSRFVEEVARVVSSHASSGRCAVAACLATCARFPPVASSSSSSIAVGPAPAACAACLRTTLGRVDAAFGARAAACLEDEDGEGLAELLREATTTRTTTETVRNNEADLDALRNTCRWARRELGDDLLRRLRDAGTTPTAVAVDAGAALDAVRRERLDDSGARSLLTRIWDDPVQSSSFFDAPHALAFLRAAAGVAATPAVSPRTMEVSSAARSDDDASQRRYVTRLLYSLEFLDRSPASPFAVDPHALSLRTAFGWLEHDRDGSDVRRKYSTRLRELVSKHCPDALQRLNDDDDDDDVHVDLPSSAFHRLSSFRSPTKITPVHVRDAIRDRLRSPDADPSGHRLETLFLRARRGADGPSSFAVDAAVVRALLSSPHTPRHAALRRDPTVLLRCPLRAWYDRGLRRVALAALRRSARAHDRETRARSPCARTTRELLAARDALLLRCLVAVAAGDGLPSPPPSSCAALVSAVREVVARAPAAVAALLRPSPPPARVIDWIVANVPEADADVAARASTRTSASSRDRAATADAVLRLAARNGAPLPRAATDALVEDATDGDGRFAARAARALGRARGGPRVHPHLRREEVAAILSRIATTCKDESAATNAATAGGGGPAAATRRRAALRRCWDAATRAIHDLGETLHTGP